jgi:ATPase subunit of ABC transporter with duplicated ATPase domains
MEKPKSKTTATTPASNAPVEYRENPRTNEKIDAWIKNNPDRFKFYDEMPHERAVRKLVLNEVEKYERMQKMNSGIMQKLNDDPEAKQAYEILLKRVPEADRERATASIAKHVFQLGAPRNDRAKTQGAGGGMRAGG